MFDYSGNWASSLPWDSDDLLIVYTVKKDGDSYSINAVDAQDGEKIHIYDIKEKTNWLEFKSYVKSTGRKCWCKMIPRNEGILDFKVRFVSVEELKRVEELPTNVREYMAHSSSH